MSDGRSRLEGAFACARALENVEDRDTLRDTVARAVGDLVPCDVASSNELGTGGAARHAAHPVDPFEDSSLLTAFEAHLHEHPLVVNVAGTGSDAAQRILDVVSHREFKRTGFSSEFYRLLSIRRQLATAFVEDGAFIAAPG